MIKKLLYIFSILVLFFGVASKSFAVDNYYYWVDKSTNEFGPFSKTECETKIKEILQPRTTSVDPSTNLPGCYQNSKNPSTMKISTVTPNEGTPGTTVVIEGENFANITKITFGSVIGSTSSFTYITNYLTGKTSGVSVSVPSGAVTGEITITDKNGKTITSGSNFTVKTVTINSNDKTNTYNPDEYKLLAPIGTLEKIDSTTTISYYLGILFKIIIGLCSVLAVIYIIVGGIQWMGQDSVFGKVEAKGKIMRAIGGLLLALGAWVLLNTINPDLLGGKGVTINQVSVTLDDNKAQTAVNGMLCRGKYKDGVTWPVAGITAEATVRGILKNGGVNVYPFPTCTSTGQHGCVSVAGLVTKKVMDLKTACEKSVKGCDVEITEGTACWEHGGPSASTNHIPGNDVVDLQRTPTLSSYVEGAGSKNQNTWGTKDGSAIQYTTKDGIILVKETSGGVVWYHFGAN